MKRVLRQQSTSGFTLIEVLAVVIIIGILFGIAAPSWVSFANSRRVTSTQDQIILAIRKAQTEAIRKRRNQSVTFNAAADPPTVTFGVETEQLGYGSYPPGRGILTLATPVTSLTFDQSGGLAEGTAVPITISVTAPSTGAKRCVIVETLLGSIRKAQPGDPGCT